MRLARRCGMCLATTALLICAGCESGGPTFGGRAAEEDIWAIRCITLRGPGRFATAEEYAEALKRVKGLKPELVQVLSDDDGTHIYYGQYRRRPTAAGESAQYSPDQTKDLERIRDLRLSSENIWPFILATMDVLPTYRGSHPEWNLENARGYWSLHVAVFYNTESMQARRTAAEEYCALLRSQGEDAYYHHGATRSSVYVGVYPENAVQTFRKQNPLAGTVETTRRIVDPQMLAAQERFPHSLHNGYEFYEVIRNPETGEVAKRLPAPSFPVLLPGVQER